MEVEAIERNQVIEEVVVGQVSAIFFENPSNFYKVMQVQVDQQETSLLLDDEIVCTGQFMSIHLDTPYEFYGKLTSHPKYGEQFNVTRYQQKAPTSESGLVDYLSSDRFKGIGKVLAKRIVEKLGLEAIDVIISDANSLKKVEGMTQTKRESLRNTLLQHQGTERVFMQLTDWGFGPKLSERIYKAFKSDAIERIKANPYELIEKVEGIGFQKADQLAEQLGFEALAIERLAAGIVMAVNEQSMSNGDTYVLEADALKKAQQLLESSRRQLIENDLLIQALDRALLDKTLYRVDTGLMIPSLFQAEFGIVARIKQYLSTELVERFESQEIDEKIEEVIEITGIQYDETQKAALKLAISSPMSIVTGGPGTGKTTLVKGLIQLHALLHDYNLEDITKHSDLDPIALAAPTGRAAKRMQEMTGLEASTIHRLIGYTRDSSVEDFYANEIDASLLIVDEMSMVDTWLMNWLMQAIPNHLQIVFVGDKDQLPSVGPGKVFSDLIESGVFPTISLTKIYRQGQDSSIIQLAHNIRSGSLPANFLEKQADRSFIPCSTLQVTDVVRQIVSNALKKGFDGSNLQVLAPMYKGPAGINALNQMLQELMNPPTAKKREINHFDKLLRVGDKVLQLVNNAEEGVYNGDIGKVEGIYYAKETESKSDEIVISFDDDKELVYKKNELDQVTLAYCCSIHKSQGSEYPLVILPLVDTYSRMLRKDLLYTAITRAQKSLVMLGNPASFNLAVTQQQTDRQTFLSDTLLTTLGNRASAEKTKAEMIRQETSSVSEELAEKAVTASSQTVTQDSSTGQSQANAVGNPAKLANLSNPAKPVTQTPSLLDNQLELQSIDSLSDSQSTHKDGPFVLTMHNLWQVDPMIGMEESTPYDFM